MRQLDLSSFTQYTPESPPPDPPPDPTTAITDGTLAQSLNNDFIARQQELLHNGPDAFYQKQGADALTATPAVLDQLDTLRDQLLGTTVNPRQRQILAQSLDNHLVVSRADVARHAARQMLAWQNATAQNRLDLLQKQAGFDYNDPDSIANYAEASRSAALHQAAIAGLPPDSDDAEERASSAASTIWRAAIEGALAKDDLKPAIALHEQAADSLSPADAAVLKQQIGAAHVRDIAREYVDAIAPTEDPPSTPADIDDAHEEASERNDDDWGHDPELHATVQHFIDVLFGQLRRNVAKDEAEREAAVRDWLGKAGPDGQPQTELPPLALWTQLDPERQQAIRNTLANNAWSTSGGSARSLIIPVNADEEEEKERKKEEERLRKIEHLPPPVGDTEGSPVRDFPLPLAPPIFRSTSPAPAPAPNVAPKPIGEVTKPPVARPSQTPSERLAASREKLRQLEPDHPELSREQPSDFDEALARIRDVLRDALLHIHGRRGRTFEECVRKKYHLKKNYDKVSSQEGKSIPDALSDTELVEIKGRAYVTMTKQLRIQAHAAKASGLEAVMYVREGAKVSACVDKHFRVMPVPKSEC